MLKWLCKLICNKCEDPQIEVLAKPRSSQWTSVRAQYIEQHSTCEVCGSEDQLVVHHIKPYHLFPELELQPNNLITLCQSEKHGVNCHLWFGHLGNWTRFNPDVYRDARAWKVKFLAARLRSYTK